MSTMSLPDLCRDGSLEDVRRALARGENVNKVNQDGFTGLMEAVDRGHKGLVKLLLSQPGVDVNVARRSGKTALHFASNNFKVLMMLLAHPSMKSHNAKNSEGWTPLMLAINHKNMDCIKELLKDERVELIAVSEIVSNEISYIEIRRLIDEERQRREEKARKGQTVVNENRLESAEKCTKNMIDELEKKYKERENIQMVNNERRFSAVKDTMREMISECWRRYEEKEMNQKIENEARLAAAEKSSKKMKAELEKKYEEREKIQRTNNETRILAVEHNMNEMRRRFEEKEKDAKIENEARLAAAEKSTEKMMGELEKKYGDRERKFKI